MNKAGRISAGQHTALLFCGRLSACLLLTPDNLGMTVSDSILVSLVGGVLLFLLFLPTILVLRRFSRCGLTDLAYRHSRVLGRIVAVLYLFLCVFILCLDVVQFYDFAEKSMRPAFSVGALTVAMVTL